MTAASDEKRSREIVRLLTQLDLYHHSLGIVGEKLVAQAGHPSPGSSDDLREKSVGLASDCRDVLRDLRDRLDAEDVDLCQSIANRVDLATRRLSGTTTPGLEMVNIWRVIEASDQFLSAIARRYGYAILEAETGLDVDAGGEPTGGDLASLFAEYDDVMGGGSNLTGASDPPFRYGILRWRGSQLFYVERAEDVARWIELDPNVEPRIIAEEPGGVEVAEARTAEGYPISLMLDMKTDENEVDDYIRSQRGQERYVSG